MRVLSVLAAGAGAALILTASGLADQPHRRAFDTQIRQNAEDLWERGRRIFRRDTFGDEAFWGGALKLHQAIAGEKLGGVLPGVSHYNQTFSLNLTMAQKTALVEYLKSL